MDDWWNRQADRSKYDVLERLWIASIDFSCINDCSSICRLQIELIIKKSFNQARLGCETWDSTALFSQVVYVQQNSVRWRCRSVMFGSCPIATREWKEGRWLHDIIGESAVTCDGNGLNRFIALSSDRARKGRQSRWSKRSSSPGRGWLLPWFGERWKGFLRGINRASESHPRGKKAQRMSALLWLWVHQRAHQFPVSNSWTEWVLQLLGISPLLPHRVEEVVRAHAAFRVPIKACPTPRVIPRIPSAGNAAPRAEKCPRIEQQIGFALAPTPTAFSQRSKDI